MIVLLLACTQEQVRTELDVRRFQTALVDLEANATDNHVALQEVAARRVVPASLAPCCDAASCAHHPEEVRHKVKVRN